MLVSGGNDVDGLEGGSLSNKGQQRMSMHGPSLPAELGGLPREGAGAVLGGATFSAVGLISIAGDFIFFAASIASCGSCVVAGGELFPTIP